MQIGYLEASILVGAYPAAPYADHINLLRKLADRVTFPEDENSGGDCNGHTSILEARNFILNTEKRMNKLIKHSEHKFIEDGKLSPQEQADLFATLMAQYINKNRTAARNQNEQALLYTSEQVKTCKNFLNTLPENIRPHMFINIEQIGDDLFKKSDI